MYYATGPVSPLHLPMGGGGFETTQDTIAPHSHEHLSPHMLTHKPSIYSLNSAAATAGGNHSYNSANNNTAVTIPEEPPSKLVERRESEILKEQLPSFLQIDEDRHTPYHPRRHDYMSQLRKRIELKNNLVAFVSEFVGTLLFLFFSFGIATEASNARQATQKTNVSKQSLTQEAPPDMASLLYSSLGFGFSLTVNAWTFYRVSGGLFNPAVTLALTLIGTLSWFQCFHLTIAQILAGIAAAALADGIIPGPLNARTTLANQISVAQGFWLEFFLTSQLIFAIYMLAAEKHRGTFLAPVGIGLALFIAELFGTNYTGGSLNPARSLGPDVVLRKFDSYHWIYWGAPYGAAIFTAAFYRLLKYLQYESVNSGQDKDEMRQVFRDTNGNVVGTLESLDANEFKTLTKLEEKMSNPPTPPQQHQGQGQQRSLPQSSPNLLGYSTSLETHHQGTSNGVYHHQRQPQQPLYSSNERTLSPIPSLPPHSTSPIPTTAPSVHFNPAVHTYYPPDHHQQQHYS